MADDFWKDAKVVYTYTRKQAMADGMLVDMEQEPFGAMRREAGIKVPVAMTSAAFEKYVALNDVSRAAGNDVKGRWWDVLWMFLVAVKVSNKRSNELVFPFLCVTDQPEPRRCQLKAHMGPDDEGQPCMTFMLPEED